MLLPSSISYGEQEIYYLHSCYTSLILFWGLGFLSMSTPSVLAKSAGNCREDKPECVGEEQKILFFLALALLAVGMSGQSTSIGGFMQDQAEETEEEETGGGKICLGTCGVILIPIIAIIVIALVKPWSIRFGIPAICSLMATLAFLSGCCHYKRVGPQGSLLTCVFRVLIAATSKIIYRPPRDSTQLYERHDDGDLVQHTSVLRCLDKAAIVVPEKPVEEQEKNRWRLCRVSEVEKTKIIIRMIPLWIPFIVIGLVCSIGNTYFLVQANNMKLKLGRIKVPFIILLWFYDNGKSLFSNLYVVIVSLLGQSRQYGPPFGVAASMVLQVLCCITAAKVEDRRLDVVIRHGLVDKVNETIPMSIFWLLPQFILLGAANGVLENSASQFFTEQAPPSMKTYLVLLTNGVFGLGTIASVVSVYLAEKITGEGGKRSWFGETLNKSRLDNYYWTLAVMSSVNLVLYILIAVCYWRGRSEEDEEDDEDEDGEAAGAAYQDELQIEIEL
ncbi:protein NRT1/ PTR FAMILY 5.5 isoform X2 [Carica papaya]|uniref:protein NRT1/ PTR FAMILY 5.5 isoform X2 n=1 Tax=Carica papaya TaxID=3649 RepID=UPI000B8CD618|nr:protein NRT1/ PTR FAMILY 5.5 isoform X2 [Carica papaya]